MTIGDKQAKGNFFNKRGDSPSKNAAVLATNGSNPNLNNFDSSGGAVSYSGNKYGYQS